MADKADVGTGATVTFASAASFTMDILSVTWGGISRESIDTSHLGTTGGKTFMPGDLYDPGELSMEVIYDDSLAIPILLSDTAGTVTLAFPTTSATFAADGFVTDFEVTAPLEERMTANVTVKFSGDITGL